MTLCGLCLAGANAGRVLHADATGRFGAVDLYPGLSLVEVRGPGTLGSRRELRLRRGQEQLLNIGYGRPGVVFGKVQDSSGAGIAGADVVVDGTRVTTDAEGRFTMDVRSGTVLDLEVRGAIQTDAYRTVFGREPTTIRTDLDVPVFVVQTETDVLTNFRYHSVRQPDSDRLRVWEMAGSAHADLHQVGDFEEFLGCPDPVNRGQQRFVLRAALRHLRSWADGGDPPPAADPLTLRDIDGADPVFELDDIGNVRGGVRTPCVDAPTQVLSGIVADPVSRICLLFGTTFPVPADALAARYGTRDEYEKHYRNATDAAIAGGFVLAEDRDELLADANPDLIPN